MCMYVCVCVYKQDTNGNEVIIGISLTGITVKKEVLQFTKFYKYGLS